MDEININGVFLTPLKKIYHPKGDIFHGMKKSDAGFAGFGEAYFSTIKGGQIKGWNKHTRMTLNLVVPIGTVAFVLYDGREGSSMESSFCKIEIGRDNYHRLTVPPGVWLGFMGKSNDTNLILNIADMEHDPYEIERLDLDQINYNWDFA
ncbi:MAG: dTDP-4-dehydrorhamnose 3,5-epimerase family protein [Candidatus Marinimicrobia bacterium]|nr:dTDP-4-dehydrorhamnose 3,5-epimerase family protein [Candidatus Neomarinimicrobiota bacterium]